MSSKSSELNDFKVRDASNFDPLVEKYSHFCARFCTPLADRMIALAGIAPGQRVLDVGTGTGVVAFQACRRTGRSGKVLGVDLSDGMVAAASAEAARAGLGNEVQFLKMDAESLELEDGSQDVVLSLFALLHFPSPLTALREMFRVVRPGGKLVLAVGSGAPWLSWSGFRHRLGRLPEAVHRLRGRWLTAPAYLNSLVDQYLPIPDVPEETALARENPNRTRIVPRLVRQAGFVDVRHEWQGSQGFLETPEEFWDLQIAFSSINRKRLSDAAPDRVEPLRQKFFSTCGKVQERGGKLAYPSGAFYVLARRPDAASQH